MSVTELVQIETFLGTLGYIDEVAMAEAWLALEKEGIVVSRQTKLSKEDIAKALGFLGIKTQVCSAECATAAVVLLGNEPEQALIEAKNCQICQGLKNKKVTQLMLAVLLEVGVTKVLIVGGQISKQKELAGFTVGGKIAFKFVEGMKSSGQKYAEQTRNWAELIVIWPMRLKHSQSIGYTKESSYGGDLIFARKGGIHGLCYSVITHYQPENPFLKFI